MSFSNSSNRGVARRLLVRVLFIVAIVSSFLLVASLCPAQVVWNANGVPVCTQYDHQWYPQIAPDGVGGAFIAWEDHRPYAATDIYAKRINADGSKNVHWSGQGDPVCTASGSQDDPQLVADKTGGIIVTWEDYRSGSYPDIYAQKLDACGEPQWQDDGVLICAASGGQYAPQLVADGGGGAIITWKDKRSYSYDLYAQRVSKEGNPMWTANGVAVCVAGQTQQYPQIASDGTGGALVTWQDRRNYNHDVYMQRLNSTGGAMWTPDGIPVCTEPHYQYQPRITPQGTAGAIIVWWDYRNKYSSIDIYAQRVDQYGNCIWEEDGMPVVIAAGVQAHPQTHINGSDVPYQPCEGGPVLPGDNPLGQDEPEWQCESGEGGEPQETLGGGVIITWEDSRWGSNDIYAQRLDADGTAMWGVKGTPVCKAEGTQFKPQITSDGEGGAVIVWHDKRSGGQDIYAQRIAPNGYALWTNDGDAVCTAPGDQKYPKLTTDGGQGAIITWQDGRSAKADIYAQRVTNSPPLVTDIDPDSGLNDDTVYDLVITGEGFSPGAQVSLEKSGKPDLAAFDEVVENPTTLTCKIFIKDAPKGFRNVVVKNTDSQAGSLVDGFFVMEPRPKERSEPLPAYNPDWYNRRQ